jgi:hypothetical protein
MFSNLYFMTRMCANISVRNQKRHLSLFFHHPFCLITLDYLISSRNSDWLRAGRPRGQTSSPSRVKNFLLSTSSRPVLGPTQPPIQWVLGALSSGVKRQGREADHSPPVSAEAKKMGIYTSISSYAFMAQCLIS